MCEKRGISKIGCVDCSGNELLGINATDISQMNGSQKIITTLPIITNYLSTKFNTNMRHYVFCLLYIVL